MTTAPTPNSAETGSLIAGPWSQRNLDPMEGLLTEYFIAKEQARTAIERKNTLERKIKDEHDAGNLQKVWDKASGCFVFDNALIKLSERRTYPAEVYSDKLREMMATEKKDGTAQPKVSVSLRIEPRD